MYTLIGARYRKHRHEGRWIEADLSNVPVTTLTTTYGDVWLFITYQSLESYRSLRFDSVANWTKDVGSSVTVQQWLTSLGNRSLPFAPENPQFRTHTVKYASGWHAGYTIEPVGRGGSFSPVGSRYDKPDLLVSHELLEPADIGKYAMFTVNGLFHLIDYSEDRLVIRDGNKTVIRSNDNQVGIYSFKDIGEITYIPITADMIHPQSPDIPLKDSAYISLPNVPGLADKAILMVIGGYLHTPGRAFTQVGDRTYKLETSNMMLLERYYDSKDVIDLESLGLSVYNDNPSLTETEAFISDATLKAYLTLEQSFFVAVDAPTFFQDLIPLEATGLSNRYLDYTECHLPVMGAYGRMLEHHRIREDGVTVIATSDNYRHNYDFQSRSWPMFPAVDAGRYPAKPYTQAQAYIRKLGVEQ